MLVANVQMLDMSSRENKATAGTSTNAANMIIPCTASVYDTAKNPPINVYATVTEATISMPSTYEPPNVDSKYLPPDTMPEDT